MASGWEATHCRGPGVPFCQAGLGVYHQAGLWSEAEEGPEFWWGPPSPLGTALTLAGLGHAERRRDRGRGG